MGGKQLCKKNIKRLHYKSMMKVIIWLFFLDFMIFVVVVRLKKYVIYCELFSPFK